MLPYQPALILLYLLYMILVKSVVLVTTQQTAFPFFRFHYESQFLQGFFQMKCLFLYLEKFLYFEIRFYRQIAELFEILSY